MPKVIISYSPKHDEYHVNLYRDDQKLNPIYDVVMDMKASHYRSIKRNEKRYDQDQVALSIFFLQAMKAKRQIRE